MHLSNTRTSKTSPLRHSLKLTPPKRCSLKLKVLSVCFWMTLRIFIASATTWMCASVGALGKCEGCCYLWADTVTCMELAHSCTDLEIWLTGKDNNIVGSHDELSMLGIQQRGLRALEDLPKIREATPRSSIPCPAIATPPTSAALCRASLYDCLLFTTP